MLLAFSKNKIQIQIKQYPLDSTSITTNKEDACLIMPELGVGLGSVGLSHDQHNEANRNCS